MDCGLAAALDWSTGLTPWTNLITLIYEILVSHLNWLKKLSVCRYCSRSRAAL